MRKHALVFRLKFNKLFVLCVCMLSGKSAREHGTCGRGGQKEEGGGEGSTLLFYVKIGVSIALSFGGGLNNSIISCVSVSNFPIPLSGCGALCIDSL